MNRAERDRLARRTKRRRRPGGGLRWLLLGLLMLALAWPGHGPFPAQAMERGRTVLIKAVRVADVEAGGRIVVEVSRAVSFDARVLGAPWRLEMLLPGVKIPAKESKLRLRGRSGLISAARAVVANGGARVVFRLRAPAVIVDAHAERGGKGRAARLVLVLRRTDARTLARLLSGNEQTSEANEARHDMEKSAAGPRPRGTLEKVKAAYRRLVEEAAAPKSIDDLLGALPMPFGSGAEGGDGDTGKNGVDVGKAASGGEAPATGDGNAASPGEGKAKAGNGPATAKAGGRPVIVVDAGHGGHDPGAIGVRGTREKDVVLKFARALREELARRGYKVVMTRDDDRFLRLRRRVQVARDHHARLFVSIHADKFRRRSVRGLGIYTLSERASDAEAAALAKMENAADLIGAPDELVTEDEELRDILVDLVQRETNANSLLLARELVGVLKGVTRLRRNPVRSAPFRVLRAPEIPSLLIELGYMSNPADVRNFISRGWRTKVAARMADTIDRFLKTRLAWR